jgi:UDP-glucuronate 4-epimerase
MKSILLTGCAGFIGSHTAEALLRDDRFLDYQIIGLDNLDPFYSIEIKKNNLRHFIDNPRFRFIEGFSGDADLLQKLFDDFKIVGVIHLAARAGVGPSLKDPTKYAELNIMGSQELFHLSARRKVEQLIFASSSSVYGRDSKPPFKETDACLEPLSPYAATKRAGELLLWNAYHLYQMPCAALRFFTVYGPRQRPEMAIAKFTRQIREGQVVELFNEGKLQRDFTYIDDIVAGILSSYHYKKSEPHFDLFNLGNSDTISVAELIRLLEAAIGKKAETKMIPAPPGEMIVTYADISKAQKLLGFAPKTPIQEGVKLYVKSLSNDPYSGK